MKKRRLPLVVGSIVVAGWIAFVMLLTGKVVGNDIISEVAGCVVAISIGLTNVLFLEFLLKEFEEKS